MLIMAGGAVFPFIRFCMAIRPPKVLAEPAQEISSIVALGAAALAYSASRIASPSSPFSVGFVQLFEPVAGAGCT